jgi:hypothetical protein
LIHIQMKTAAALLAMSSFLIVFSANTMLASLLSDAKAVMKKAKSSLTKTRDARPAQV